MQEEQLHVLKEKIWEVRRMIIRQRERKRSLNKHSQTLYKPVGDGETGDAFQRQREDRGGGGAADTDLEKTVSDSVDTPPLPKCAGRSNSVGLRGSTVPTVKDMKMLQEKLQEAERQIVDYKQKLKNDKKRADNVIDALKHKAENVLPKTQERAQLLTKEVDTLKKTVQNLHTDSDRKKQIIEQLKNSQKVEQQEAEELKTKIVKLEKKASSIKQIGLEKKEAWPTEEVRDLINKLREDSHESNKATQETVLMVARSIIEKLGMCEWMLAEVVPTTGLPTDSKTDHKSDSQDDGRSTGRMGTKSDCKSAEVTASETPVTTLPALNPTDEESVSKQSSDGRAEKTGEESSNSAVIRDVLALSVDKMLSWVWTIREGCKRKKRPGDPLQQDLLPQAKDKTTHLEETGDGDTDEAPFFNENPPLWAPMFEDSKQILNLTDAELAEFIAVGIQAGHGKVAEINRWLCNKSDWTECKRMVEGGAHAPSTHQPLVNLVEEILQSNDSKKTL
eukprot:Platyproteum_vivax@DN12676_c0_g1_i1.p1